MRIRLHAKLASRLLFTAIALFTSGAPNTALAAKLGCSDAVAVMQFALQAHLTTHELTPALAARTLERFASLVEAQKTTLTREDLAQIQQILGRADPAAIAKRLFEVDCGFFIEVGEIVKVAHRRLSEQFPSADRLAQELVLEREAQVHLADITPGAPSLAPPTPGENFVAQDPAELRKMLIASLVASVASLESNAPREAAARFVSQQFLSRLYAQRTALAHFGTETMLKAFSLALDPHTNYMTRAEAEMFQTMMAAGMEGLGIVLELTPHGAKIAKLIPDSPAARSGKLAEGEVIVAINGRPIDHDVLISEVIQRLRGRRGSSVQLTLATIVEKERVNPRSVHISRDFVSSSSRAISSNFLEVNQRLILSIRLDLFYAGSGPDLRKAFASRQKEAVETYGRPIDVVVFDLRGNGGGSLADSLQIAGLFSDASALVGARNGQNQVRKESDGPLTAAYHGPLVIAIDEGSASASEIVSGTFKDLKRALIVGGERTFGKGTVQVTEPIEGGDGETLGALKITVAQFYTAGGNSTQNVGVSSHVVVPGPTALSPGNQETALKYAIESSKIEPLVNESEIANTSRVDDLAPKLQEASKARIGGRPTLTHEEQLHEIHQVAAHYCDLLLSGERTK